MRACHKINYVVLAIFLWMVGGMIVCNAQIAEHVYRTDYHINPENDGALFFELDNISFFKNNEYAGSMMDGYTLPGLWVQPKLVYYPFENIKLEAGAHMLRFWGANRYPNYAYQDIAEWKGSQFQKGFHVLPFFRVQVALSEHVDVVLGSLYGGSNHHLIEPLYNPELNLSADPEAGLQLLYTSKHIDVDVWVNWESFIFKNDTHQEAFTFGLSSSVRFNAPDSRFHFYAPIQVLAQHRGGEIDTLVDNSVQTLMNAAVGVGCKWNTGHPVFKNVKLEVDAVGYSQQAGDIWPFDKGGGIFTQASADIYDFRVKAAYFTCHDFISMLGIPFYGTVSTSREGVVYNNPGLAYLGLEYSRQFGKGFALGIDVEYYHSIGGKVLSLDSQASVKKAADGSFSAGIYLRINPSFLLKRFKSVEHD